jgi:hypothetical protein
MKVRISAVILILALAAWLPIQAQQAGTQNAPATQAQAPAASDTKAKDATAHSCCHGKNAEKASCCAGKEAKDMTACCGQKDAAGKTAMNCCEGKKGAMCAAKGGNACCSDMNAKDGKTCCAGKADHCAAHANGK